MAEEEEVVVEVEAVQAVYGDNCVVVFDSFPPHLHLRINPRTADVSSQQFVEALIGIQATLRYPNEPPLVYLIESKGLDSQRQNHLITAIQHKASQLSSCLMLVALCEEAVEQLSLMNHPDGDCPLCLYPLVTEEGQNETLPFMKLMSCFHCFHSECIIRWWNWHQKENMNNADTSSLRSIRSRGNQNGKHDIMEEGIGSCPVCRKIFHTKDIEHVLSLVGEHGSESSSDKIEVDGLLKSDLETIRRQKFEAVLKLQQENSGIIEPKKEIVVVPGMYLPQRVIEPTQTLNEESTEEQQRKSAVSTETIPEDSSSRPSSSGRRNSGRRKPRVQNSRKQSHWVKKEDGAPN